METENYFTTFSNNIASDSLLKDENSGLEHEGDQEEVHDDENNDDKQVQINDTVEEISPKLKLDSSDFSVELLNSFRADFLKKYRKIKYLLLFDKSITAPTVSYFMINPADNTSLLPKAFKFSFSPIRDLIFYRVVQVDYNFYVIGGLSTKSNKVTSITSFYDSKSNKWKDCARMIVPRCKFSVSVAKNFIYVIGGQDIYGTPLSSVERYDIKKDTWTEISMVNDPVKFHSSCTVKDKYIVVSGGAKTKNENFKIYNIESSSWRNSIATMDLPLERENHAMVEHNGSVYLIGGIRYEARIDDEDNPEPINENSIHSLNLNSFSAVTNHNWKTMSHPKTYQDRNGPAVVSIGKYIYIIGGHMVENNENERAIESRSVERFDPKRNQNEKVFMLEQDVPCFDCDCCIIEIDPNENETFSIDALFLNNYPLW